MSIARLSRDRKRQLGQFLTPTATANEIVGKLSLQPSFRILEPSFGEGSFVFAVIEAIRRIMPEKEVQAWCKDHLFGCEIDERAYASFTKRWVEEGLGPVSDNLELHDFFSWMPPGVDRHASIDRRRYFASHIAAFDLVIGNPPFGGSIDPSIQDELDAILGYRDGRKIKKETYAFFLVKGVDLLKPGGQLVFICSDTILTIPTMTGLRAWLQDKCTVDVSEVPGFFSDTNQNMLLISLTKRSDEPRCVTVFGSDLALGEIESTPNVSWRISADLAQYFAGSRVGDLMTASSGMTIGNNELFLRAAKNGEIEEPFMFEFGQQEISVEKEIARARLGKVPASRMRRVAEQQARGETERVVIYKKRETPLRIRLPHPDYRYYNKATSRIIYSDLEWVIFWRDEGDYVYTFKKTGNWYLHGVGGMKYFGREGLTWSLIAPRLYTRYLPSGYILDSGAPCAFLRPGIRKDELFFILGWSLTDLCNRILKEVLNHTRNIQSKDFERLPYPSWVGEAEKAEAISCVKDLIESAKNGDLLDFKSPGVIRLNGLYQWKDSPNASRQTKIVPSKQLTLF